jgi:signal transduction histidine kinase
VRRLRRWYEEANLQTKFALQVVLSTTLLFSVLLPLVLYLQRQAILSNVEDAGFQLAKVFAQSSVQAVVADDYLVMQHVVNGIGSERKVLYAMLLGDKGRVLVHTRVNERGTTHSDPLSAAAVSSPSPLLQRYVRPDGVPVYDFSVPVYVLDERRATVRVGLSIQKELADIARTRNSIILLGLGALACGVAWATYRARRLTRPVGALVRGTEEIARGNLGHRIPVGGGRELGQLAAAFNRMTQSVQALIETSRQLSSTLDLDVVLRSVAAYALDLVKSDSAAIALVDRETRQASLRVVLGARTNRLQGISVTPGRGLGGAVLSRGTAALSLDYLNDPDIAHDPLYDEVCREEGFVAAVAVPIRLRGDIVGVLWVANRTCTTFTREDIDTLERMAPQTAIAIENARLYAETRLKTARLESLLGVSQAITSTLDTERIVRAILSSMSDLMNDSVARLWVLRESEERLVPLGGAGAAMTDDERRLSLRPGEGLVGTVAVDRRPLVVGDVRDDARVAWPDVIEREQLVSFLGLPLLREDRLLGVLCIATRAPHCFADEEVSLFASFAQQAAIALENARLYQDLKNSHEELIAAQEELVNKTRMAAIGEISAAVAHEVRNPLGAISNCVQMLRTNPHITGEDAELLEIVHTESQRLNEIISDFLTFGRPRPPRFEPVDLQELIEDTLALLRREQRCRSTIAFSIKLDPAVPLIKADRDQLRQVFWNLFLNAVQAMGDHGHVRVESRRRGECAEIEIQDSGRGISRSIQPRIFEPFYTTRAAGTGLGLATVRRIIEEHHGKIRVDSEPGVGTCFTVTLPFDQKTS